MTQTQAWIIVVAVIVIAVYCLIGIVRGGPRVP
jgi:hypothetical protein